MKKRYSAHRPIDKRAAALGPRSLFGVSGRAEPLRAATWCPMGLGTPSASRSNDRMASRGVVGLPRAPPASATIRT